MSLRNGEVNTFGPPVLMPDTPFSASSAGSAFSEQSAVGPHSGIVPFSPPDSSGNNDASLVDDATSYVSAGGASGQQHPQQFSFGAPHSQESPQSLRYRPAGPDRSAWLARAMKKHPDILVLRERLRPISRHLSFAIAPRRVPVFKKHHLDPAEFRSCLFDSF